MAKNIRRCQFTPAEQTEIDGLRSGAPQPAARTKGRELIDAVKTLGYFPKETKSVGPEEKALAKNIRRCQFTPAEQTEIDGLRRTSVHPRDRDRSAQLLEEAQEPPNPMEGEELVRTCAMCGDELIGCLQCDTYSCPVDGCEGLLCCLYCFRDHIDWHIVRAEVAEQGI